MGVEVRNGVFEKWFKGRIKEDCGGFSVVIRDLV